MSVCCECCVLSSRGFCDEVIILPEESYRMWCVFVCDLETSLMRRPWFTGGCCSETNKQTNKQRYNSTHSEPRRWVDVAGQFHARLLYFRKRTFVGGPQRRTGSLGEENKFLVLVKIRTPDRPARSLVTIPLRM
jgi:hypothetical protein